MSRAKKRARRESYRQGNWERAEREAVEAGLRAVDARLYADMLRPTPPESLDGLDLLYVVTRGVMFYTETEKALADLSDVLLHVLSGPPPAGEEGTWDGLSQYLALQLPVVNRARAHCDLAPIPDPAFHRAARRVVWGPPPEEP